MPSCGLYLISYNRRALPAYLCDRLELRDAQRKAFVSSLGTWLTKSLDHRGPRRLIDGERLKLKIQQHEHHGVEFFGYVYRAKSSFGLAQRWDTAPLDLHPPRSAVAHFSGVITRLACCCKLQAQQTGCFKLGHFARYAQGFVREGAVALRQDFCLAEQLQDFSAAH
ncbi:hypothetical protein D9M70_553430 [compost metagenome]